MTFIVCVSWRKYLWVKASAFLCHPRARMFWSIYLLCKKGSFLHRWRDYLPFSLRFLRWWFSDCLLQTGDQSNAWWRCVCLISIIAIPEKTNENLSGINMFYNVPLVHWKVSFVSLLLYLNYFDSTSVSRFGHKMWIYSFRFFASQTAKC